MKPPGSPGRLDLPCRTGRWEDTATALALTLDGRLHAQEADEAAEEVILDVLEEAGSKGALREKILTACDEAGLKTRGVSAQLTKMWKRGRLAKKPEDRKKRYWLAEHAPADAEECTRSALTSALRS